jgi:CheY-like chemotaxis protein
LDLLDLPSELISHGAEALERLKRTTPQLVLLDLNIPGRSGIEILSDIRATEQFHATKVIIVTGDRFVDVAQLHQADAVLFKPFTLDAFQAAIIQFLQGRSSPRASPESLTSGL